MSDVPALPAEAVLLHVGAPKTGTSSLQAAFFDAREPLRHLGVLYPGQDVSHNRHVWTRAGYQDNPLMQPAGDETWEQLVSQTESWQGRVVISAEVLTACAQADAAAIVRALGGRRVWVLVTARAPAHQLGSVWQEYVKAGGTVAFRDWCDRLAFDEDDASAVALSFRLHADYAALARRWAGVVGPERVILHVNRPRADSGLQTFIQRLLGLPNGTFVLPRDTRVNASLTLPEAEALRTVNQLVHQRHPDRPEYAVVPEEFVRALVAREPGPGEPRVAAGDDVLQRLMPWCREVVAGVAGSGIRICGALADLLAMPEPAPTGAQWAMPEDLQDLMAAMRMQVQSADEEDS